MTWTIIATKNVGWCPIVLGPPHQQLNVKKPLLAFLIPQLPKMYNLNCCFITPLYTNMVIPFLSATIKVGWMNGHN